MSWFRYAVIALIAFTCVYMVIEFIDVLSERRQFNPPFWIGMIILMFAELLVWLVIGK